MLFWFEINMVCAKRMRQTRDASVTFSRDSGHIMPLSLALATLSFSCFLLHFRRRP